MRCRAKPSPLQLVAYLPLIESVDWPRTEASLLRTLSVPLLAYGDTPSEKVKTRAQDEGAFWKTVRQAKNKLDEQFLADLWNKFPDSGALASRAKAYQNNGDMQPTAPKGAMGMLTTPALYDWIDISLTLTEQQKLPVIAVRPWKNPKM